MAKGKRKASKRRARVIAPRARIQAAVDRFTGFRGEPPASIERVRVPPVDPVVLTLGVCTGIMYATTRDGRHEKYLHRFKQTARPLLAVSSDGHSLYLIGGSYSVTDKGIEDQ